MRGKRGVATILWYIIEAILITLAIVIFFQYIDSVKNNTLFEQQFLARDIALMTNTISSIPGEVQYTYASESNLSRFNYVFADDKIKISAKDSQSFASYPYYYDSGMSIDFQDQNSPKQLEFARTKSSLKINEHLKDTENPEEKCPLRTDEKITILVIDYDNDAEKYAHALIAKLSTNPHIVANLARTESSTIRERSERISQSDYTISFGTGLNEKVTHSNSESARSIGCHITDKLNSQGIKTTYTPVDSILTNAKIAGIRIIVGSDENKVAVGIASALKDYNE